MLRLALRALAPVLLLAASFVASPELPHAGDDAALMGFTRSASPGQRDLERNFDKQIDAINLRRWMEFMTARPHHVGSPHGRANAEMMLELFRSWGYDARIETYQVLFPTPRKRVVELLMPGSRLARLVEPPLAEDRTSGQQDEQLPSYNAYSIDGNVRGQVVYVNYGIPEDYEELERRGISVKDRIVLARYGGSWRGIKPKVAAEKGAVGCLLYSDPRDDGYFVGDTYPGGGFRPGAGVQRGSVADMPLYPGDPLTPSVGATEDAERLPREQAPTLTKIPVLPISHEDALPILQALSGPVAPASWRGALPVTYHLGPGPAEVRLEVEFDWDLAPAHNVIATLAGSEFPDQWILRGNHHDAWVNGATDPVSGMVALLEEARALASLTANGWRPRRTVVYAAWDAEEPGLLGSTEWVEHHAEELREKAAVYINSDSNSRGFLSAGGSHTLELFVNEIARDVEDPFRPMSVLERRLAREEIRGSDDDRLMAREHGRIALRPLGSGSDYTPFLQHLGISSLNVSYGGEGDYGQYHSIYDSFDHFIRFMDPGFDYGVALARTNGRAVLRLTSADLLPFEFIRMAATVSGYVDELMEMTDTMREETAGENRLIEKGYHLAAADPRETYVPPLPREPVPHLSFAPLENAADELERAATGYDRALQAWRQSSGAALSRDELAALNGVLLAAERALTRPEGLPDRPWYVHHVYAPGYYTGYGVKTIPGVREAIEQRRWTQAEEQVVVAADVLRRFAGEVSRAAAMLEDGLVN